MLIFCTLRNTHAFKKEDPEAVNNHPEFLEELGCRGWVRLNNLMK